MALKKQLKSFVTIIFTFFLITIALFFLFNSFRLKSHLIIVNNHLPWKVVDQKVFYNPLYHTSLSSYLVTGDHIQSINGIEINSSSVLMKVFSENLHDSLSIKVLRNQQSYQFEIKPVVLLFEPEGFLLFLALIVMAVWYSFFNKKNTLLISLLYLLLVMAMSFCFNSYLHPGLFILYTLGSTYPFCFYMISLEVFKNKPQFRLFKLFVGISYGVLVTLQITAYINNAHDDIFMGAHMAQLLLNQGGFLSFILYLVNKMKKNREHNGLSMVEWQFSGFLLFYIPYLFFEVLPLFLKGFDLNLVAAGSYSYLFLSSYFIFSTLAKVLYKPVFLSPLEDKWLYLLFNLLLFLLLSLLYPKFLWPLKGSIPYEELRLFLVFGFMLVFALFFMLKKLIPLMLLRFFPNQRIYLNKPHLYMYRKAQEEYYWKHRFHQLEAKLLSDQLSFGINHVHQFFMSSKSQVARFLNMNEKSQLLEDPGNRQWNQLLSLNQYLQNLCDRTMPVIDTACRIELSGFLKTIIAEFSEHSLFSSLVLKSIGPLVIGINQEEIKFILLELIKNALEALDTIEGIVEISVKKTMDHIIISVVDSGNGIFLNQRDKLFSPFFTTKSNHLGMGLFISRLYAVKNHGLLRYSKADHGGSCFQLFLPEKKY